MDCPCSCAVAINMIFSTLLMPVHTGNVGASGSSPALRPPVTYMVCIPRGDDLCFRMVCVVGDLPVAPTAARWSVWVICNVLSMIVHAGSVGASGSSPALRLRW